MLFKGISIFSSCTNFDKWSITICAVLVENIMGNTPEEFGPNDSEDVVLRYFYSHL